MPETGSSATGSGCTPATGGLIVITAQSFATSWSLSLPPWMIPPTPLNATPREGGSAGSAPLLGVNIRS